MNSKILIGSVLKPVNDARMYEKIAISLSQLPGVEIHVAGFKGTPENPPSNIQLHPLFDFPRLSVSRLLAPWKFYKLLLKVKPDAIIITTHDLLLVTSLYKILFGGKILYDVQENYFRNILYGKSFPAWIRPLLAGWVRLKEWLTRPLISHYFLAEKNYEKEFSFSEGKSTVLENKARKPGSVSRPANDFSQSIRLLYSGTIAGSYGVFDAVNLAKALHEAEPKITLTIIGYSSKKETLIQLKEVIADSPFIQLKGGDTLVPHTEILKEIQRAHFGLLPYLPNKSTYNCIPTKLYEYLAYQLPMLVRDNPTWTEMIRKYQAGLTVDFTHFDAQTLLQEMQTASFYSSFPGDEIYWESEEEKLIQGYWQLTVDN